jgi:hypothetical protein
MEQKLGKEEFIDMDSLSRESAFNAATKAVRKDSA